MAPSILYQIQERINEILSQRKDPSEITGLLQPLISLSAVEQIRIYQTNRLRSFLNTLRDLFPFSCALLGARRFREEIAFPYLSLAQERVNQWNILELGKGLVEWVKAHYQKEDRHLVIESFYVDELCDRSFRKKQLPLLSFDLGENLYATKCSLQPHVSWLRTLTNLLHVRQAILRHPQKKQNLLSSQPHSYVIYRNQKGNVTWEELKEDQFLFLASFQPNCSLQNQIDLFKRKKLDLCFLEVYGWLHGWIEKGFFALYTETT